MFKVAACIFLLLSSLEFLIAAPNLLGEKVAAPASLGEKRGLLIEVFKNPDQLSEIANTARTAILGQKSGEMLAKDVISADKDLSGLLKPGGMSALAKPFNPKMAEDNIASIAAEGGKAPVETSTSLLKDSGDSITKTGTPYLARGKALSSGTAGKTPFANKISEPGVRQFLGQAASAA